MDMGDSSSVSELTNLKTPSRGAVVCQELAPGLDPGNEVSSGKPPTMAETGHSRFDPMLAKTYILRDIASKKFGIELPFFEATIHSSDILQSFGIEDDYGGSKPAINNTETDKPSVTHHSCEINLEKSIHVLSERLLGINTMTGTISILDSSEIAAGNNGQQTSGTPIPLFDGDSPMSEIGRIIGIDEYLESWDGNQTSYTSPMSTLLRKEAPSSGYFAAKMFSL
ncbi:hypothetical protein KGF57_001246 [Candida theae]|uniref:Uncharacterized protein n=1 Tax=Candida theae TaxID=1198502 RepID=A0AAD5G038_9ASCO|nr:uncharacterized protein KGF57_001246 [Candida theae]KAI5963433.1 hypothetical protein KGF57_001246 [Candida theae]